MKISVVVCTWNRADLLDKTLLAMQHLRIPEGCGWELLVVNNNCADHTDKVLSRHGRRLPLKRLFEARQGLSHSRNCAVEAAIGDLVVWTDDDVIVDPGWLSEYVEASRRWPDAAFFGGLLSPMFEVPPPGWMRVHIHLFEGVLVIRDFGPKERPFGERETPFGANMAFRSSALKRFRFDPNLGRQGAIGIVAEEVTLIEQLRAEGATGVWVPGARVQHFSTRDRLTWRYVWNYFVGLGRTAVRFSAPDRRPGQTVPRWLYRQYLQNLAVAHWRWLSRTPGWIETYRTAAYFRGMIAELRRMGPCPTPSPPGPREAPVGPVTAVRS